MPSFLFTRRVTQAVQIAQLITHVAAIRARENNSGRYQCFFNRFNPVWCGLKNLSYQTNQKRFFANRTRNNSTNPTNLKRLIPIEHDLNLSKKFNALVKIQWWMTRLPIIFPEWLKVIPHICIAHPFCA